MADEIIIRIIGEPTTDAIDAQAVDGQVLDTTKKPKPKKKAKTDTKTKQALALGAGALMGKQAWSFATSNVARYTGDAKAQQNLNFALEIVGYGALVVANPVLGSISFLGAQANKIADIAYTNKWLNIEAGINAERLGIATTGRSGRNVNRR